MAATLESGGQTAKGLSCRAMGHGCACADRARLEGPEGAWLGGSCSLTAGEPDSSSGSALLPQGLGQVTGVSGLAPHL